MLSINIFLRLFLKKMYLIQSVQILFMQHFKKYEKITWQFHPNIYLTLSMLPMMKLYIKELDLRWSAGISGIPVVILKELMILLQIH
jgi:hypothetical protein